MQNQQPTPNQKVVKDLCSLVQLDIDAVHAYSQAIEKIDIPSVHDRLTEFKADHEAHVSDLSECIRDLGGEPPEFSRDFKGFIIEGMTILRSVTGTAGALKAMKMNEDLTNATYERALAWELPPDVRMIVQKNRADEARHLKYIEDAIARKVWEEQAA